MNRSIIIMNIKDKDSTVYGQRYPGTVAKGKNAEIIPNKSIRLFGYSNCNAQDKTRYEKTFAIGDAAEYDSYNLHYTGIITGIKEKYIEIKPDHKERKRRLSIYEFNWRNYDFDDERIAKHNFNEMQYI